MVRGKVSQPPAREKVFGSGRRKQEIQVTAVFFSSKDTGAR